VNPIYIFDLDGTLADDSHRVPLLDGERTPDVWRQFFARCVDDQPIPPVIQTFRVLTQYAECWIWTGRSDEVRDETVAWLNRHLGAWWDVLRMRAHGDHTPDTELKRAWLRALPSALRERIAGIFEDRTRVVQMWRDEGMTCFQVAPGDF